jgi:putative membrane protein
MMPGYGYGMGGWGWIFMSLSTLAFLALIALVVWAVLRTSNSGNSGGRSVPGGESAREILAQRYARGEIDDQEYQQRLRILSGKTT